MNSVEESLGTLARSASVIFLGTLAGQLLGLVGETLIIRSLPPDFYGVIAFAYTIVFALGTILLLGVHDGVTRQLTATDDESTRERVLQSGYLIVVCSGVLAVVVGYVGRGWLASVVSMPRLAAFLLPFLPFLLLFPAARVSFATLRAQKRSTAAVVARHLAPRTIALGALLIALAAGSQLAGAVGYWLLVPAVTLGVATYFVGDRVDLRGVLSRRPSAETTRHLWAFSWPLAVGSIIFLFLRNLDILMIGYFLNAESVGLYRSIQPLRQVTTFVLNAFTFVFLPIATEYYESEQHDALGQLYAVSTKWILVATFPPVLLFTFFAPDVIRFLFGTEYVAAAPAMSVLIGGLTVRALTGLNGDIARAIDRPRIELYSAVAGVAANFVLNLALIPRFGILGAAAATVAGYTLYNGIELVLIRAETGLSPFRLANVKPLLLPLCVAAGLAYWYRGGVGFVGLAVIGGVIAFVQLLSLVVTRSVDEADILLLARIETRLGIDLTPLRSLLERQL